MFSPTPWLYWKNFQTILMMFPISIGLPHASDTLS